MHMKTALHARCVRAHHHAGNLSSPRKAVWKWSIKYIEENFYVDNLLKSVNTVQEAVTLIRNVTGMYAAGGFKY